MLPLTMLCSSAAERSWIDVSNRVVTLSSSMSSGVTHIKAESSSVCTYEGCITASAMHSVPTIESQLPT